MRTTWLIPLLLLLPGTAFGAAPPALSDGEFVTYRVAARKLSDGCPRIGQQTMEWVVNFGLSRGRYYLLTPRVEPEELGVPPVYYGTYDAGGFAARREDVYTVAYAGRLRVSREVSGRVEAEGQRFRASMRVQVEGAGEPADPEVGKAIRADFRLPCTTEVEMEGTRVDPRPADVEKTVRVWELLKEHMDLMMTRQPKASLVPLKRGLAIPGDHHPAFLWRMSRALHVMGEHLPRSATDERLTLFARGAKVARRALQIDPDSAEATFFASANQGRWNTTSGLWDTVTGLEDFEKNCLTAIRRKLKNDMFGFKVVGDAHYALGQFYRLVPDSWLVEQLLGTRGDIKKSVYHLRQAVKEQPLRGDYMKELGASLLCVGDDGDAEALAEGKQWLERALATRVFAYPPETEHEQIRRLLADPGEACSYSRDTY